jgi:hypothetical protein
LREVEERRREGERRRKGKGKRKRKKEEKKEKERKKREKKNRKREKKNSGKFRKLGKIVREIRGRVLRDFSDFRARRIFRDGGTAACAGFPARWPTAALGRHAWVLARVRAVPTGFAARAPG